MDRTSAEQIESTLQMMLYISQEEFHEIKINKSGLNYEYDALLKNSSVFLGEVLKQIILSCFTLKKIDIELTDYSLFVFPALKGLEGYIKKLFGLKGITIQREGFGDYFSHSFPKGHILTKETKTKVENDIICSAIEEAYNLYNTQRHSLFHVDSMIETTRTIDTKLQAEKLIDDVINLIETTYTRLI